MKSIAIIPARGGSKRLKNKNIKIFYGKPILQRTVEILKKSQIFDSIILTTDSAKIKKLGKKIGIDVIIDRSVNLSKNSATTIEVIQDAIKKLTTIEFDIVCCIYPCNPLLLISDLKKTSIKSKKERKRFIFPVCEYTHPIERGFELEKNNNISFINKKNANINTQTFTKKYHDAGQFYWAKKEVWLKSSTIHNNSKAYIIPKYRAVDIDDIEDWKKAKALFKGLD